MKEEEKLIEVYQRHVGLNAEWQYIPTPREWVLNAMKEYAEQENQQLKELQKRTKAQRDEYYDRMRKAEIKQLLKTNTK